MIMPSIVRRLSKVASLLNELNVGEKRLRPGQERSKYRSDVTPLRLIAAKCPRLPPVACARPWLIAITDGWRASNRVVSPTSKHTRYMN